MWGQGCNQRLIVRRQLHVWIKLTAASSQNDSGQNVLYIHGMIGRLFELESQIE